MMKVHSDSPVCQVCGEHHEIGGEALACDHINGREEAGRFQGGLHREGTVRGCPWCEAERKAVIGWTLVPEDDC